MKINSLIYIYCIVQNYDVRNIDRLASFTSLTGKILMDNLLENLCTIQLENIERKIFDRLLAM